MVGRRRGIAIIDVIIGSVMLSVGLAVVISMSSRSLARQSNAERQISASWLADEILSMVLVVGPDEYVKTYPSRGKFDPPYDQFSYEIEIEDNSQFMPLNVMATIYWDVAGTTRSIAIETFIARKHGEPVARTPAEPVNREERYWQLIEARETQ